MNRAETFLKCLLLFVVTVCAGIVTWDYHKQTAITDTARDAQKVLVQASGVLSRVDQSIAIAQKREDKILGLTEDTQSRLKGLIGEMNVAGKSFARTMQTVETKTVPAMNESIAKMTETVGQAQPVLKSLDWSAKALQADLDKLGITIDATNVVAANASGLIGATGSTGTVREVVSNLAGVIGNSGATGSVGSLVAHGDATMFQVQKAATKAEGMLEDLGSGKNTPFVQRMLGAAVEKVLGPVLGVIVNHFAPLHVKVLNQPPLTVPAQATPQAQAKP